MIKQQRSILGLTDEEIDQLQPHLQTRYLYELCKDRSASGEFVCVMKDWNDNSTVTEIFKFDTEYHMFIIDEYGVILSHTKETF
jgi:recombinational DNA repair protein RecR